MNNLFGIDTDKQIANVKNFIQDKKNCMDNFSSFRYGCGYITNYCSHSLATKPIRNQYLRFGSQATMVPIFQNYASLSYYLCIYVYLTFNHASQQLRSWVKWDLKGRGTSTQFDTKSCQHNNRNMIVYIWKLCSSIFVAPCKSM